MNVFKTIVHQTLRDNDNPDYVEDHGPFPVKDVKNAYLGSGYYFWDDHIELAHWWGEIRCENNYIICQGVLNVEKELFCDLVGCRQDMIFLKNVIARIPELHTMALGSVIEFLKELDSRPNKKGIFPFKVIRAIDTSENSFESKYEHDKLYFSVKRKGFTTFAPQIMICLVEKNKLHLNSYKVIHPNKYVNE